MSVYQRLLQQDVAGAHKEMGEAGLRLTHLSQPCLYWS
jgi:hypothetical protein